MVRLYKSQNPPESISKTPTLDKGIHLKVTEEAPKYQDLATFTMPTGFRGKPAWFVQLWWIAQALLFRPSPQFMYGWRVWLLRRFGARIGKNVVIRPSASIVYPWKLTIGDYSWIGDEVVLYTLGDISIGRNAVVSQRSYLCAGSHDPGRTTFDIIGEPISVEDECWIATDVFICPGVTVGYGTIVAARSTVTRDIPSGVVAMGSPARPVRQRTSSVLEESPSMAI